MAHVLVQFADFGNFGILCAHIGVAREGGQGARSIPIKIPSMIKKLRQHSLKMFSCSCFFSVITHIAVINNNINDNEGAPGPLTNNQGAPGPITDYQGAVRAAPNRQTGGPEPLTNDQGGPGPPSNNQGAP